MTEQETRGVVAAAAEVGDRIVTSLPAQFHIIFLGLVFWFLDQQSNARERVLTPLFQACLHEQQRQ